MLDITFFSRLAINSAGDAEVSDDRGDDGVGSDALVEMNGSISSMSKNLYWVMADLSVTPQHLGSVL